MFIQSELRFVATVTTDVRVKFLPTVKMFPENNVISCIICVEVQYLHITILARPKGCGILHGWKWPLTSPRCCRSQIIVIILIWDQIWIKMWVKTYQWWDVEVEVDVDVKIVNLREDNKRKILFSCEQCPKYLRPHLTPIRLPLRFSINFDVEVIWKGGQGQNVMTSPRMFMRMIMVLNIRIMMIRNWKEGRSKNVGDHYLTNDSLQLCWC